MNAIMAPRIRMIVDTTELLRRAVQIRAAATGASVSEVVNSILEKQLKTEMAQATKAMKDAGEDE